MDVTSVDDRTFILHTERITISGDRYLIYYTFTCRSEEADDSAVTDAEQSGQV